MVKQEGINDDGAVPHLVLIQHWFEELKARVPVP